MAYLWSNGGIFLSPSGAEKTYNSLEEALNDIGYAEATLVIAKPLEVGSKLEHNPTVSKASSRFVNWGNRAQGAVTKAQQTSVKASPRSNHLNGLKGRF